MTGRTVNFWNDFKLFGPTFCLSVRDFQIQLGNCLRVSDSLFRISMTIQAPFHRERLHLSDNLHFVNATVAFDATNATLHMGTVVEINKIRQIVNTFPLHRLVGFQTFTNWGKRLIFRKHDSQRRTCLYTVSAMAISAGSRGWNAGMSSFFNRIVTITTIQLQHTRMGFVAERHRLPWLVTHIDGCRMHSDEPDRCEIAAAQQDHRNYNQNKPVHPIGKMEFTHVIQSIER